MSLSEDVRPLLAARAATDPNAARLLEMFTKADEILSEHSLEGIGNLEIPRAQVPSVSEGSALGSESFCGKRARSSRESNSTLLLCGQV